MIKFQFNDGGRLDAGYKGLTRDCVCRSIAIAAQLPYQDVYTTLAEGNKTQRKSKRASKHTGIKTAAQGINTKKQWFKDYMQELGFTWVSVMGIGTGCTTHLNEKELPTGRIIVSVSTHYAAVVDGILNDTHDCSRGGNRCVYGYWIIK